MADTSTILKNAFLISGAVVGFIALKKIAETFGLIQTKEEAEVETATEQASQSATQVGTNPFLSFNPNFAPELVKAYLIKYKPKKWNATAQMKLSQEQYIDLAKQIYDSKGVFNDDEDKLYNVFRNITTQWQLSLLSSVFSYKYKKDMLEYIKGFTNAEELAPILKQVQNYPQYFK